MRIFEGPRSFDRSRSENGSAFYLYSVEINLGLALWLPTKLRSGKPKVSAYFLNPS